MRQSNDIGPICRQGNIDVIVSLSGGLDSCVSLRICQMKGLHCAALHIDFGLPSSRAELRCSQNICKNFDVPLEVLSLRMQKTIEYRRLRTPVFGAIQLMMLSAALAQSVGASKVAIGLTHDEAESVRRDPRWTCAESLLSASLDDSEKVSVLLPVSDFSKGVIKNMSHNLGISPDMTWSCMVSSDSPCGICQGCIPTLSQTIFEVT
jgi:7-cyano-7-deazaguanine synthase in queuosine biosynthesis